MRAIMSLAAATMCGVLAVAQQFELKNDRLVDGSTAAIQLGFAAGDIGCAVLNTSPGNFPLRIVKVQIFWLSGTGGMSNVEQGSINFYNGGGQATPNPLLITKLDGPIMQDGGFNEFDITPYNIVINQGPFSVGLEFLSTPDQFNGPSMVTDTLGCQSLKNIIYDIITHKWYNACSFGISGNLAIRVIGEFAGDAATVTGKVNLGGSYIGQVEGTPVTITILSGQTVVDTQVATLDEDGHYSIFTHNLGTFDVRAKASHWLSEKATGVNLQPTTTLNFTLNRNADVDGNNVVDLFDLNKMLVDFTKTTSIADVDGSGQVDALDLNLALTFFGQAGH